MPKSPTPATAHQMCGATSCRFCGAHPIRPKPRPLTTADLAWQFGESEAAMGVRSAHGAFVDMALSGIQSGGRSNGVEAKMIRATRLHGENGDDPIAKHRCIHARLARLLPGQLAVLRAAYGPDDWTRAIGDVDVRDGVQNALKSVDPATGRVLPLTVTATAHAARKRAPSGEPCDDFRDAWSRAEVTHKDTRVDAAGVTYPTGVHCAFRPPPPPKLPKPRPLPKGKSGPVREKTAAETLADKLRKHFSEQPGLAGSARGAVIAAACHVKRDDLHAMTREAAVLVAEARKAAGVVEQQARPRTRAVLLMETRSSA